jgi:hypothetical protein
MLRNAILKQGVRCTAALKVATHTHRPRLRELSLRSAEAASRLAFKLSSRINDEHHGITWFNALTDRGRAAWLAAAQSACPADAWRFYKQQFGAAATHEAFLHATERMPR